MTDITQLLNQSSAGDASASRDVYALLYPELRRIAHSRLRQGSGRVSLDTTALVHDGYLRFVQTRALDVKSRSHFLAYASKVMRSVVKRRAKIALFTLDNPASGQIAQCTT